MTTRSPRATALAAVLASALAACAPPVRDNLLFISLDTVRRDHLSTYGYAKPTTPVIDELARRSAVFEAATAQWTTTVGSHASMFTGLYPRSHQIFVDTSEVLPGTDILAEVLRREGFRTAGFVSGYPMKARGALHRGFEEYDWRFKGLRRWGNETLDLALAWLGTVDPEERYFLFAHFYDAHGPYRPGPEELARFVSPDRGPRLEFIPGYQQLEDDAGEPLVHLNDYVDRYDAMIGWLDGLVARLLAAVDLERTVVVILSDHGETLGERAPQLNLSHGTTLFEEQIGIPLILYAPGIGAGRYGEPVETIDLLPTLAELLGVPLTPGARLDGESLVPILSGERDARRRPLAFATTPAHNWQHADRGYRLRERGRIHSARNRRWKLILYPGVDGDYHELYDLAADPGETRNLAAERTDLRDRLEGAIRAWSEGEPDVVPDSSLSEDERRQMRALGYVD